MTKVLAVRGSTSPMSIPVLTSQHRRKMQVIGQAVIVLWATFTLASILLTALPGDAASTRYADPELRLSPEQIQGMWETHGADNHYSSVIGIPSPVR